MAISCSYDSIIEDEPECADEITYESGAGDIVNASCAVSGCHVPGTDADGVYTSYQKLLPFLSDGSIERAILDGSMPPPGSPDLAPSDREALLCWIQDQYPER